MVGTSQDHNVQCENKVESKVSSLSLISVHSDEYFMKQAYQQALVAFDEGEVPVGAIVTCDNRIIGKSYNQTERLEDSTAHAEMLAITAASNNLGSKYLAECTLYVTLEPCVMCAGATFWSQISRIVYGASDPQRGYSIYGTKILHPKTELVSGVMEKESKGLLDDFFKKIRN